MAIYKDIPRFDGSGITEYYRINDGKIVKLSSDYDFLEDKPMINGVVLEGDLSTADLNIPVGDITQLKTEIKDNIVNAINELHTEANDFEKFITDKVNAIISFTIVWVAKLPAKKDAKPNTVYLVPKTSMIEEDNYCEEFIFTDGHWEKIGDTKVDLSGYYTKEEIDSITQALEGQVNIILQDYATKEELEERASELERQVDTILEDYATKENVQIEVNGLTEQIDSLEENIVNNYVSNDFYNIRTLFPIITPPADGGIYCVNDGEMETNTFYQIPYGVKVGYRNDSGTAVLFSGYINNTEYLNSFRAVSFFSFKLSNSNNYGTFLTTRGNPSWVYNAGFASSHTGLVNSLASAGNFREPTGYLRFSNGISTLPTSYSPFDSQYLTGNAGYKINQSLNSINTKIGTLTNLETENQDNLVDAINEANSRLSYVLLDVGAFRSNTLAIDSTMTISSNSTGYSAAKEAGDKIHQNKQMPILAAGIYEHIWLTYTGSFNSSGAMHGYTYEGILNDDGYYYIGTASFYYRDSDNSFVSLRFSTQSSKAPVAKDKILTKTNTTEYTPTKDYHPSTKLYVDTAISNAIKDIHSFEIQIVDQLPTDNILTNTLYLVPSEKVEDNNTKDEYIYTGTAWEMIGTTKVDLSNYYTKPEVDKKVDNLYLRCNRDEYEAMPQEDRDSFLIAIVDDIAVLSEQDLTNVTKILGGNASADMEIDISTNEAIAITDKIIGGTE